MPIAFCDHQLLRPRDFSQHQDQDLKSVVQDQVWTSDWRPRARPQQYTTWVISRPKTLVLRSQDWF